MEFGPADSENPSCTRTSPLHITVAERQSIWRHNQGDVTAKVASMLKWWQDSELIRDCVKSVVYNLKTDLAKLEYELDIAEQEQGCCGHTEEIKKRIKRARVTLRPTHEVAGRRR